MRELLLSGAGSYVTVAWGGLLVVHRSTVGAILISNVASAVLILLLQGNAGSGDDLETWLVREPFPERTAERECAQAAASGAWRVRAIGEHVTASPYDETAEPELPFAIQKAFILEPELVHRYTKLRPRGTFIEVEGGFLVGFHGFEWGSLWWFSRDGTSRYRVTSGYVSGFHVVDGAVLAISGYAKFGSWGAVSRIARNKAGRWHVESEADLGAAALVSAPNKDGGFTIVTTKGVSVYQGRNAQSVHSSNYSFMAPNSIIQTAAGDIYIGMNHVVVRLRRTEHGYRESWLVPPFCPRVAAKRDRIGCICVSGSRGEHDR